MGVLRATSRKLQQDGVGELSRAFKNLLRWHLHKRLTNERYLLTNVQGHRMYLDLREKGISRSLATSSVRERVHTEIITEEVTTGMTVLDLGANIGYYTLLMARNVGSSGRIYAVEPYPPNFELLQKNVASNGYDDRVESFQIAISDRNEPVELALSEYTNLHKIRGRGGPGQNESITVDARTIDSLQVDRPIDFVRMDIEGHEEVVLSADCMGSTLKTAAPDILFEAHSNYSSRMEQTLSELFESGYYPKLLVSAGVGIPTMYANLGYEPEKIVQMGPHERGIYRSVSCEDAIQLILNEPKKLTRYALLSQC